MQFKLRHLLGAYSKWFNIRYQRSGKLFEERHERKFIDSETYLRQLIIYINRNPENHGVVKSYHEYPWSSHHALIGAEPTWIAREKIIALFENQALYLAAMDKVDFDDWLKQLQP